MIWYASSSIREEGVLREVMVRKVVNGVCMKVGKDVITEVKDFGLDIL